MSNFIKLYESIINERLSKELARLDPHQRVAHREQLEATSSVPLMAEYLRAVIEDGLRHYKTSEEDLKRQISIANDLIRRFGQLVEDDSIEEYKITEDMLLRGISDRYDNDFRTYWSDEIDENDLIKAIKYLYKNNSSKMVKDKTFTTVIKQQCGKRRLEVINKILSIEDDY